MNYTAGQMGVSFREETDLYKDEIIAKNYMPSYLPKFINIETKKLIN